MNYPDSLNSAICELTSASEINSARIIQSLWSGYGSIQKLNLSGGTFKTAILKHIRFPDQINHPRGWTSDLSHQRKVSSYQVEMAWYRKYSAKTSADCRVPVCYGCGTLENGMWLLLEDLDEAGFDGRRQDLTDTEFKACLKWLAYFHAIYMSDDPEHLWQTGSYWHLATRPDEWQAMTDSRLKSAAAAIDKQLEQAKYQTFVHGDAKVANFCFANDRVAAVDFQYVGRGCGMKDLSYFIGSCLEEEQAREQESVILAYYFSCLSEALQQHRPEIDAEQVESEWRALFYVAWADFHRFLEGWSPEHWKINGYTQQICERVLDHLGY